MLKRRIAVIVGVAFACALLPVASRAATAVTPTVATIAGGPQSGAARSVGMSPWDVTFDGGDLYIIDSTFGVVRKIDVSSGAMSVVEGDFPASGDGPAQPHELGGGAVTVSASGDVIVTVARWISVRSADGSVRVVAGGPDDSTFNSLSDVVARPDGTLLVVDWDQVREVDTSGAVRTVAGGGTRAGASADGHPATDAALGRLGQLALGPDGSVFVEEVDLGTVRRIDPHGVITTIANDLQTPLGLAIDDSGGVIVSELFAHQVVRVESNGSRQRIAGTGAAGSTGDGGLATNATLDWPGALAFDPATGALAIADAGSHLVRAVATDGTISTLTGNGTAGFNGDGALASATQLIDPQGVAVDRSGGVYVADAGDRRIRRIGTDGRVTTVAGDGRAGTGGDGGAATNAQLVRPTGLALDANGNLYIADEGAGRVRRVGLDGRIITVAGGGSLSGDALSAKDAALQSPVAVAVAPSGSIYIAEYEGHRVRAVLPSGAIVTVAGTGVEGFGGDGGPARAALLDHPAGVAVDRVGNLFIADFYNGRVRAVSTSGLITTYLDKSGTPWKPFGAIGSGFDEPYGVAVDPSDHLVATSADTGRVVRVLSDGSVQLLAGCCNPGLGPNNGPVETTSIGFVTSVAVDATGRIFFADGSQRVKTVTGVPLPATSASLLLPSAPPLQVTAGDAFVTASWESPASSGATPLLSYTAVAMRNNTIVSWQVLAADVRSVSIDKQPNGQPVIVYLAVTNAFGSSPLSVVGATPTSGASLGTARPPTAPTNVQVSAGNTNLRVHWSPARDQGSPIVVYAVVAVDTVSGKVAAWRNTGADERDVSLPGLVNGRRYDVYLSGVNAVGFGAPAITYALTPNSSAAAPRPPAVPGYVLATPAAGGATVQFGPALDEGSPITAYSVIAVQQGVVRAWVNVGSTLRRASIAGLQTGIPADLYVVASSSQDFGAVGAPATITPS